MADAPSNDTPLVGEGTHLDVTGLKCPLPALLTAKALRALPAGARLTVSATDPMAAIDVPNAAREAGARLDAAERDGAILRFRITASAPPHS